ncbi:PREDICTED: probable cytochrome P450 305a1 isoform X2 [Papilio polytes]|uniref:probable cytochrome P450 305a1 isoform X2 n=1 Tax=Papilio polytes TaxID=76194 RepID=UPI000675BE99|nr:PREDICTED: probable cytochrome P450 305a1 isoform X2 [Papilio polytes]
MIPLSFILLLIIIIIVIFKSVIKPKNYPPGPKWIPYLGCSNVVNELTIQHGSQWKALSALAKEFSTSVLGLKMGMELVVVVYGEKNIRQVFTEKEFEGITFADGPLWREQRLFAVKQLRSVGFGKSKMEKEIQNEMMSILKCFKRYRGKPCDPQNVLATSVMNVLWTYIAGERIEEKRLKYLLELLSARSKAFTIAGGLLNQAPWCRFIFPELSGYSLINRMNEQISAVIEEHIEKHKKRLVAGSDFIYSFLEEMESKREGFTEEQLKTICLDVLIAGSQTTSNVLSFALLTLLRNRDIQDKIYKEINQILGTAPPTWSDVSRLVYTNAFLQEVYRYYTIVPLMGPRRTLADTFIDGYFIPKETTVLMAVGDLHIDPRIWCEPKKFKPERFIDQRGALKNIEHLYPFGLGRRRCPGDTLAKSFVFIVFVGILQKFEVDSIDCKLPSLEPIIGLISAPRPYSAVFTLRRN